MRVYKHVTAKTYKHLIMRAYKNLTTHTSKPKPQHLSTIIKAFDCTNVQLHDPFSLKTCRHIIIQVFPHVCGY